MPLRVLLVEDDRDSRESLALLLRLSGFEVDAACGRAGALDAARAHPPDAVLMDLGLPGCDGFRVAKEVRGLCPAKPLLIALTGYAEQEYRRQAEDEGFDVFLAKPADPVALVALLQLGVLYRQPSRLRLLG